MYLPYQEIIYSQKSEGCHSLIKQGAKLVTRANDIVEEYNFVTNQQSISKETQIELGFSMTAEEQLIYDSLSFTEPKCIDEIIYKFENKMFRIYRFIFITNEN